MCVSVGFKREIKCAKNASECRHTLQLRVQSITLIKEKCESKKVVRSQLLPKYSTLRAKTTKLADYISSILLIWLKIYIHI